jgi:hypothetical protein
VNDCPDVGRGHGDMANVASFNFALSETTRREKDKVATLPHEMMVHSYLTRAFDCAIPYHDEDADIESKRAADARESGPEGAICTRSPVRSKWPTGTAYPGSRNLCAQLHTC